MRIFGPLWATAQLTDVERKLLDEINWVRLACENGSENHPYVPCYGYRWGKTAEIAARVGFSFDAVKLCLDRLRPMLREGRIYHYTGHRWYLFTLEQERTMSAMTAEAPLQMQETISHGRIKP